MPRRIPKHREIHHHRSRIRSLAAVSGTIWSGGGDGMVAIHNPNTLNIISDLRVPTPYAREAESSANHSVTCILPVMNGARVWTGTSSGGIAVWDANTHSLVYEFAVHEKDICCLCQSTDGSKVWCGSADHTISVWDIQTHELQRTISGHSNWVRCLVAIPGEDMVPASVWSGSDDASIKIWNEGNGECWRTTSGHSGGVLCSILVPGNSADNKSTRVRHKHSIWDRSDLPTHISLVWTGSCDRTIRLWNTKTGDLTLELTGHSGWVSALCLAGTTGEYVVSGSSDRTIRLWSSRDGQCLSSFEAHAGWVTTVASIGQDVWSGGSDVMLRSWDLSQQEERRLEDEQTVAVPKPRVSLTASLMGGIPAPSKTPQQPRSRPTHQWDNERQRFMTPASTALPPVIATPPTPVVPLSHTVHSVTAPVYMPTPSPARPQSEEKWVWDMDTQGFVQVNQVSARPLSEVAQHVPSSTVYSSPQREEVAREPTPQREEVVREPTPQHVVVEPVVEEEVVEEETVEEQPKVEEEIHDPIENTLTLALTEAEEARKQMELGHHMERLAQQELKTKALQDEAEVMRIALDEVMQRNEMLEAMAVPPTMPDDTPHDRIIEELKEQNRGMRVEVDSTQQRLDAALRELQEQLKQTSTDRLTMAQLRADLEDARNTITKSNNEIEHWKARELEAEKGIGGLQMALSQLRSQLQESEGRVRGQIDEQATVNDRIRTLENECRAARRDAENELQLRRETQSECERLSSELAVAKEKVDELEHSIEARVILQVEEEKEKMRSTTDIPPRTPAARPPATPLGLSVQRKEELRRARESLNQSLNSESTPKLYRSGRWDNDFDTRYNNVLTPSRGIGLGVRFSDIPDGSPRDVAEALARRFDTELGDMRKRLSGQSRALAALEKSRMAMEEDLKAAWWEDSDHGVSSQSLEDVLNRSKAALAESGMRVSDV